MISIVLSVMVAFSHVSMLTLLGKPDLYDKEKVKVVGVLRSGATTYDMLYFDSESKKNSLFKNALELTGTQQFRKKIESLDGEWVVVTGTFDGPMKGKMNVLRGGVKLDSVESWEP